MSNKPLPNNPDSARSGPVPDHPVARGRAGAFRGRPVSARDTERATIARRRARLRACRGRGGADRRAAVRPLQCRRLCRAFRRSRLSRRGHAGTAAAQRRGDRLRHRAGAAGAVGHRHVDRDRRSGAARRRRHRDGRAHPAGGDRARSRSVAPRRPGNSCPMPAPISRAARRCCAPAPSSARARSACWPPAALRRSPSRAGRASPSCRPATNWCSRASRCAPAAIYDTNGAIVTAAISENGGEARFLGAIPDDEALLEAAMRKALADQRHAGAVGRHVERRGRCVASHHRAGSASPASSPTASR